MCQFGNWRASGERDAFLLFACSPPDLVGRLAAALQDLSRRPLEAATSSARNNSTRVGGDGDAENARVSPAQLLTVSVYPPPP